MSSVTFFFLFIPILALILLAVNFVFAPHSPYQEKGSTFECGFHSFLGQNRTQFSISFFIFALLFLLFDLEILLVYPYVITAYSNSIYGLIIMLIFFLVLTLGFAFELGKNALSIDSKQISLRRNIVKSNVGTLIPIATLIEINDDISNNVLNIILFIFILTSLIAIVLAMTPDKQEKEEKWSTSYEGKWAKRANTRQNCIHQWVPANYLFVPCGYKGSLLDNPCNSQHNMHMCRLCAEMRCGSCKNKNDPNMGKGSTSSPSPPIHKG